MIMEPPTPAEWERIYEERRNLIREAHEAGTLSHTRACRVQRNTIAAYVYDRTSPTGVRHLASIPHTPEHHTFLRDLRASLSPLSPTEAR